IFILVIGWAAAGSAARALAIRVRRRINQGAIIALRYNKCCLERWRSNSTFLSLKFRLDYQPGRACHHAGAAAMAHGILIMHKGPLARAGATVIDGNGGLPLPDAVVVVTDNRITAVGPSATTRVPADAKRIDVRGKFVLPGLIDAHVHLGTSGGGPPHPRGCP